MPFIAEPLVTLEPIHVRISKAPAITGESRMALYDAVRKGELDLIKDDAGRSFLLYAQLKERCAKRKISKPKENPRLAAARDAYHAKRKAARKRKPAHKPAGKFRPGA
jgi:hypothetical protein